MVWLLQELWRGSTDLRHNSPEGVSGLHEEDVIKTRLTMGLKIMGLAMLALASSASVAGETQIRDTQILKDVGNGCHLLMTDKECADHTKTLARLSPGGERDAYLLVHRQLLREREKACACSRNLELEFRAAEIQRPGRQAMLQF